MIINMLEAVSAMLKMEATTQASTERVKCAKLMLDKIIEGMKEDTPTAMGYKGGLVVPNLPHHIPQPNPPIPPEKAQPETGKKPERHDVPHPKEPSIEVDEHRTITKVHNALPDTMIELDGKKYTPTQVIGMTFQKGKIL
jgi:hypothetical protein